MEQIEGKKISDIKDRYLEMTQKKRIKKQKM